MPASVFRSKGANDSAKRCSGNNIGLAHGYWHDERTRECLFRLPSTGERVYATGDPRRRTR